MNEPSEVAANLIKIRTEIDKIAKEWRRPRDAITLIAVSKTKPIEAIIDAIKAGQQDFGENRVQEALEKYPALKTQYPDIRLHLIGPLQTNKVKDAVRLADAIHSLDREKLARTLADEMQKQNRHPDLFIQVNIGEEPQKAGIAPLETPAFIELCRSLSLPVKGLMCIPPLDEDPSPYFALLAKIAAEHDLPQLSMGMSGDFAKAIALGATFIRVGSAIFGER